MKCQKAPADLQRRIVSSQQQDALAPAKRGLQIIQALDAMQSFQFCLAAPPGKRGFGEGDADRLECKTHQAFAFARTQLGKTKSQVG